jgi:hypothetical protein
MDTDALLALMSTTATGCPPCEEAAAHRANDFGTALVAGAGTARWSGVLCVEGEVTGDGRLIEPNALRWENLPLPLRYVAEDSGEHNGAVVVGNIETITRGQGGQVLATGIFDTIGPDAVEAMRQVKENLTNGVSVDLDDVSFEIRVAADLLGDDAMMEMLMGPDPDSLPPPDADGRVKVAEMNADDEVRVTTDGRIRAATIVAIPAFAGASIHMADEAAPDQPSPDVTKPILPGDTPAPVASGVLPDGTPCSCSDTEDDYDPDCDCSAAGPVEAEATAPEDAVPAPTTGKLPDGSDCSCDESNDAFDPDCDCSVATPPPGGPNTEVKAADGVAEPGEGTPAEESSPAEESPSGRMPDGTTPCSCDEADDAYDPDCNCGEVASADRLIAAAIPVAPPASWFSRPSFTQETALRVTPDGRVLGHLAGWNTCHISHTAAGQCVKAPHSSSDYAYFLTGTVLTAEGAEIPVGHLTLDTRHAGERLTPASTSAHYENTGTVVADVTAGEDAFGVWVAGALRPTVTPNQIRSLRSAPLSGDWRRIGASLELVAALAVNVPGFPVPRPHGLVAGGVVKTLVAAGMIAPKTVRRPGTPGALSLDDLRYLKRLADRERREEQILQASGSLPAATELARRVRTSSLAFRAHRPLNPTGGQ